MRKIKATIVVASLAAAFNAFGQENTAVPSVDSKVPVLLQTVAQSFESGVLSSFQAPSNLPSLSVCQVFFESDTVRSAPAPQFYPRATGEHPCSQTDAAAMTAAVPAHHCTFIGAQGLLNRNLIIDTFTSGATGNISASTEGANTNSFSGLVCNDTDESTPLNLAVFGSGNFNWAAIARIDLPIASRDLERSALATLNTYMTTHFYESRPDVRATNIEGGPLAITGAQLAGRSFTEAKVCKATLSREITPGSQDVNLLSLAENNRLRPRTEGSNQCADPAVDILGQLAPHKCALIAGVPVNNNLVNGQNTTDIDLQVSLEGSALVSQDLGPNNLPTVVICNNGDAAKNIILKGRQFALNGDGESLITRIEFDPVVLINFPRPLPPADTVPVATQNLVSLLHTLSEQAMGSRQIESEQAFASAERRDMLNVLNFSGVNFETLPVCSVTMPARSTNTNVIAPELTIRVRADEHNGCTEADITAIRANLRPGRCMAVFIRGLEQNAALRDIDAFLILKGTGANRNRLASEPVMSTSSRDNLPIMVKCNRTNAAMHPEIHGEQFKANAAGVIAEAEAVIARFDFPAPPAPRAPGRPTAGPAIRRTPVQRPAARPRQSPAPAPASAPAPGLRPGRSIFVPN